MTTILDAELLARIERLTAQPLHPYLKRAVYGRQYELSRFLDTFEQGRPLYIYSGYQFESKEFSFTALLHFTFLAYLQEAFAAFIVIPLPSHEATTRDIIACGLDYEYTYFFPLKHARADALVASMKNQISTSLLQKVFAFSEEATLAEYELPLYRIAAANAITFSELMPASASCLVVYNYEQENCFHLARSFLKQAPACLIGEAQLSSVGNTTLLIKDSAAILTRKLHLTNQDSIYQYLRCYELDSIAFTMLDTCFLLGTVTCDHVKVCLLSRLLILSAYHRTAHTLVLPSTITAFLTHVDKQIFYRTR